jgi:hypothetical protein
MNIAYFNSTIHELNEAATYLNKYAAYVNAKIASIESQPIPNGATSLPGYASPCGQLALLAVQLIEKIDNVSTKTTKNINKATADIATMQTNILAQISTLEGLMIIPTDLPSVLTWINKIINTFAGPYATYTGQQATLVTQEALLAAAATRLATAITTASSTLTSAISDAQSRLGCAI